MKEGFDGVNASYWSYWNHNKKWAIISYVGSSNEMYIKTSKWTVNSQYRSIQNESKLKNDKVHLWEYFARKRTNFTPNLGIYGTSLEVGVRCKND